MSEHVPADTLGALASETLPEADANAAREHIATCSTCSAALFERVARTQNAFATGVIGGPAPLPSTPEDPMVKLPRGSEIGRYVVLDRLGTGGMGVVYAAFDPELDRRIAIKILQSHSDGSAAQSWLLREAQAMARLSHPNVISVHDVGLWNDRVFVAMELVEGQTLRTWMQAPQRPWRETLRLLIAAGHGLAAAHAAGIVHRDFKPENVLLGKDGRVRVLDFGLARAAGDDTGAPPPAPAPASPPSETASRQLVNSMLTQAGVVMGTLPYMAPEQLQGRGPDLRSDQFAFAVTLHELLYGTRPFVSEKSGDPQRWVLKEAPASTQVPPWVRKSIARALAVDPAARFASMDELLVALGADPTASRRRIFQSAAAALLLVGAVAGTWALARPDRALCSGAAEQVAAVWGADRAARIQKAFAATNKPFAAAAAEAVRRTLDAYGSGWTAQRIEACEATRVRGDQTEAVMALKMACLDRRLAELGSLAAVFETADGAIVQRAPEAAAALSPLTTCADVSTLIGRVQPRDSTAATDAERLSKALATPAAYLRAGSFARGLEQLSPLLEEARKLGYAPLLAEASLLHGELLLESGELKGAERALNEAAAFAQEGRADDVAAAAWERLTEAVGVTGGKFERGWDTARFASATLVRLGARSDLQARLLATRARLAAADGKYAESLEDGTEAVRLQVQLNGEDHPATAFALNAVALAHLKRGELELAEKNFRRALGVREKVLGPNHPDTATSAHGLATALQMGGKFPEARELYLRAIAVREVSLGDKHSELARSLNNLAALHAVQGQFAEAEPYAERALAILEAVHGPENPYVAYAVNNLGDLLKDQGRPEEALEYHQRALAIREKTVGREHTDVAMSLHNIADCLRTLGRHKEALERNLRAVAIREKVLPTGHKDIATSLVGAALTYLELSRPHDAVAAAERAVAIREAAKVSEVEVADARFLLARALRQSRKETDRAKNLVEQSRSVFEAKKDARRLGEVKAFLAAQGW